LGSGSEGRGRAVDIHRSCAIGETCEGHGICCRCSVHMVSGLRILVVNNAPLPRLSHARCASIREQGKAAAILIPNACSSLRVVRFPVSLRSSPRYRVRMFSNIVNPVIVLSRTILSMGCWRWLSAICVIGTICGCGVGVQLLEQFRSTYAHCSLFTVHGLSSFSFGDFTFVAAVRATVHDANSRRGHVLIHCSRERRR